MALKVKKVAGLALVVTAVVIAMAWLINVSGLTLTVAPLFSVQDTISSALGYVPSPISPFTSSVPTKVFSFLSGYIPGGSSLFDLTSWAIIYMSSFLILLAGTFIYGFLNLRFFKSGLLAKGEGVFWALILGTVAFWLVIVGTQMAPTNIIGGLLVYLIPVSYITALVAGHFGIATD